jgi:hypothetical protein
VVNKRTNQLDPQNVVYQSRVLQGVLDFIPAMIWHLQKKKVALVSERAMEELVLWLRGITKQAGLLKSGQFLAKDEFKERGYLGSGGIARLRNVLWAASIAKRSIVRRKDEAIAELAEQARQKIFRELLNAK